MSNMKMKIQKLNTAVLLGVMVATTMTSFGINAAEIKDQAKNEQIIESSVVETNTLNMEAYIKGLTMLTEKEKAQLLATEEKLKEDTQALDKIYQTLDQKLNQALQIADIGKMYDDIMAKNEALWKKLEDNITPEQDKIQDERAFINASKVLTKVEKATLLKEVEEREKLDRLFEEKEAKVLEENKDLLDQAEKIEQKIQAEDVKNQSIWDKVAQYEASNRNDVELY